MLVLLVTLAILGSMINGRRMKAIYEALREAPDGPISPAIKARIQDPVLLTSVQAMAAAILGASLVMSVKPGLRDSIIIVISSMLLGAGSAQLMAHARNAQPAPERAAVVAPE